MFTVITVKGLNAYIDPSSIFDRDEQAKPCKLLFEQVFRSFLKNNPVSVQLPANYKLTPIFLNYFNESLINEQFAKSLTSLANEEGVWFFNKFFLRSKSNLNTENLSPQILITSTRGFEHPIEINKPSTELYLRDIDRLTRIEEQQRQAMEYLRQINRF